MSVGVAEALGVAEAWEVADWEAEEAPSWAAAWPLSAGASVLESVAEPLPLPPERYQVARKTRTVATRSARISRMRLEVRKEEGG